MNGKNGKTICQWWKILKYHMALRGLWLDYMVQKSTCCYTHGWSLGAPDPRSILAALLKTHGHSLDKVLRTLVAETEAIINSSSLTVESLSDVNNEIPLSPSNLLTMKSDVIMPPQGVFNRPKLYSCRQWR